MGRIPFRNHLCVCVCVLNNYSVQESINFILNCFIFFSFIFLCFFFVFSFSLASVSIIKDPLFCYIVLLLFFFFTLAFSFFSIPFFALLIVFKMNKRHSSPHVFYRFECRFFLFHCCDSLYVIPNVFFPVAFSLFFSIIWSWKLGGKKIISFLNSNKHWHIHNLKNVSKLSWKWNSNCHPMCFDVWETSLTEKEKSAGKTIFRLLFIKEGRMTLSSSSSLWWCFVIMSFCFY